MRTADLRVMSPTSCLCSTPHNKTDYSLSLRFVNDDRPPIAGKRAIIRISNVSDRQRRGRRVDGAPFVAYNLVCRHGHVAATIELQSCGCPDDRAEMPLAANRLT